MSQGQDRDGFIKLVTAQVAEAKKHLNYKAGSLPENAYNDLKTSLNQIKELLNNNSYDWENSKDEELKTTMKDCLDVYCKCHQLILIYALEGYIDATAQIVQKNNYMQYLTPIKGTLLHAFNEQSDNHENFYKNIDNIVKDINDAREKIEQEAQEEAIKQGLEVPNNIDEALRESIRCLFNLIDQVVSGILWGLDSVRLSMLAHFYDNQQLLVDFDERSKVKTFAETATPFAYMLTGKAHFFNPPRKDVPQSESLAEGIDQLNQSVNQLQKVTDSNNIPISKQ